MVRKLFCYVTSAISLPDILPLLLPSRFGIALKYIVYCFSDNLPLGSQWNVEEPNEMTSSMKKRLKLWWIWILKFFCDKSVTSLSSSPAEVGEVNKEKCCGALAKGLDQQAFNLGAKTATGKFFFSFYLNTFLFYSLLLFYLFSCLFAL